MKILAFTDAPTFPTGVGHQLHNIIKYGSRADDDWVVVHPPRSPRAGETKNVRVGKSVVKLVNSPKGYADDAAFVMSLVEQERPDALVIFTDPWAYLPFMQQLSYWIIERNLPLIYYHVWDNYPSPLYNIPFWMTCNATIGISMKSTINILIAKKYVADHHIKMYRSPEVMYLPHAVEPDVFRKMDRKKARAFVKELTKGKIQDEDFLVLYNNRNISRKNLMDSVYAFLVYAKNYNPNAKLLIKTDAVVPVGTDVPAFLADVGWMFDAEFARSHIVFITNDEIFSSRESGLSREEIALLYNASDIVLQLSSNEGFGIASLEASLCGAAVIATMTGGIADQRSLYEKSYELIETEFLEKSVQDPVKELYETLHDEVLAQYLQMLKKYNLGNSDYQVNYMMHVLKPHRHFQGSPATPYILDDRVPMGAILRAFVEVERALAEGFYAKHYEASVEYINQHFSVEVLGREFRRALEQAVKNNHTEQLVIL